MSIFKRFKLFRYFKPYVCELALFFKNVKYLNYLRLEYTRREENEIEAPVHYSLLPVKIAQAGYELRMDIYEADDERYGQNGVQCVYINGIMTDLEMATTESYGMAEVFGKPFTLFHNISNGFAEDIYDCLRMKVGSKSDENSQRLKDYIQHKYTKYNIKKFLIVGYSQGSIIACHAIDKLPKNIKNAIDIQVLTFGSAQSKLASIPNGAAYHVCHDGDFVARMGAINYFKKGMYGELLKTKGYQHGFGFYQDTIKDHKIDQKIKQRWKQ